MVGVPGKSRGCGNCRKRKIRCDLNSPTCTRCSVSKIQCDGYDRYPVFINRTASGIQKRSALEEVKSRTALCRVLQGQQVEPVHATLEKLLLDHPETGWTHRERHSLHFFRHYSTSRLSGHYDQDFWSCLTLQLSQSDAAIRHLLVAIGAIHEEWEAKALASSPYSVNASHFALAHCNRAIGLLTDQSFSSRSTLVILTSSLLLAVIELLQGRHDSAYRCLKHGLCLRDEWRRRSERSIRDPQDDIIALQIEPMFAHYSSQAEQSRMVNSMSHTISHFFKDFTDAREALNKIVHDILSSNERSDLDGGIGDNDNILAAISMKFQQELEAWFATFTTLLGVHVARPGLQRPTALLNIRYRMARIMAAIYPHHRRPLAQMEAIFDAYQYDFHLIVQWSQIFLASEKPHSDVPNSGTFSFDSGVIFPLSFTASSCRYAEIRQQAMHVLRQNIRHEGFCNSHFVAFVMQQIITIEEEKISDLGFIEPINRVRLLHLEYFPSQTEELALLKLRILRTCPLTSETYETTEARSLPPSPTLNATNSHWTMEFGRAYATPTAWEIQYD